MHIDDSPEPSASVHYACFESSTRDAAPVNAVSRLEIGRPLLAWNF